ncbi:Imm1 family immunity protein [Actinokineospora inagensis]|uniref:Imm1 family immunity protein n=1 Tax=Actinokineospora inagensis TaxID=103730 RepID=UPI00146FB48A|nr:Imm1 family immunity protein [Actinokineospora inagensis]
MLLADLAAVRALVDRVRQDSVRYDAPLFTQWCVDGDADSPEFCVGVDGDVGVLSYTGRAWPGLWSSHNGTPDTGEVVTYSYMSNATEFSTNNQIPYPEVLAAAEFFFVSGGDRPSSVAWQEEK